MIFDGVKFYLACFGAKATQYSCWLWLLKRGFSVFVHILLSRGNVDQTPFVE